MLQKKTLHQVVLSTGSNLGDRKNYLAKANTLIAQKIGKLLEVSPIYETAAWGGVTHLPFLNQVILVQTHCTPTQILAHCMTIEKQLDRVREQRWDSRTMDIDVLFYDDLVIETPELVVPHPRLHERNFVLLPLNAILPKWQHPILNKNVQQLVAECPDQLPAKIIV